MRQQFQLTYAMEGALGGAFRRGVVQLHAGELRSHQRNRRIHHLFVNRVRIIGADEGASERHECLRIRLALPQFCFDVETVMQRRVLLRRVRVCLVSRCDIVLLYQWAADLLQPFRAVQFASG